MVQRIFAGVLMAVVASAAGAADQSNMEALRAQLKALKQQVQQLEKRLDNAEKQQAERAKADDKHIRKVAKKTYKKQQAAEIDVGGAIRFQYSRKGRNKSDHATVGNINLDTVRLNFDGSIDNILFSGEYRFYSRARFIHHGWFGYQFSDHLKGQLGIQKVPFGILPYASHNFFFSSNYYLGLEDDYDSGIAFIYKRGAQDLRVAFFKNDEYNGGNGNARYSYDPLSVGNGSTTEAIKEANTGNLRYAYTFGKDTAAASELGLSLQAGQIYDSGSGHTGNHWAAAGHLNGNYGRWNLMLQVTRYEINPESSPGFDDAIIGTGAYGAQYTMPAQAWTYIGNIAYAQPVAFGPITKLTYYNDFTYVDKDDPRFGATVQNVLGMSISAGDLFTYVDFVLGKNQPFTSPYINSAGFGGAQFTDLGSSTANAWTTRFNINVGFYF